MNRNADLSHDRRRNLSTISVRQLPGQNSQRPRKSPEPGDFANYSRLRTGPGQGGIQRVTHWHIPGHFGEFFPPGGRLTPRHAPPRQSGFRLSDWNPPLTPTVHWLRPLEGRFPPVSALERPP